MSTDFFVNDAGKYMAQCDTEYGLAQGWKIVSHCPQVPEQTWDFVAKSYDAPPRYVPEQVPALAGMLTLDAAGFGEVFQAWADDPSRTFAERAFLNKAMTWRRQDPTVLSAAAALGISAEQVDDLFVSAELLDRQT